MQINSNANEFERKAYETPLTPFKGFKTILEIIVDN